MDKTPQLRIAGDDAALVQRGEQPPLRFDDFACALDAHMRIEAIERLQPETLRNGVQDWVYPEELYMATAFWWSPDSKSLIYSMAGSLWRQDLALTRAEQLTAGPGYDYQPDCSPDGRWVVFARYDHDAVELWGPAT